MADDQWLAAKEGGHLIDLGTFTTGVLTGLGASALLAALFKRFLEEGIANWFKTIQQARGIVGQAEIQYRQQQLSEFYGPLYAYLKGLEVLYRLWMAGKLHHVNEAVKANFRQQNQAMLNVIRAKAHLIDEETFPHQYCGQNLGCLIGNDAIVTKRFVIRAGFFHTLPVG